MSPPGDQRCVEDEDVVFTCELNKPDLEVAWTRGELTLGQDEDYEVWSDGCIYFLRVLNASVGQTAEYTVTIGDLAASANLTVDGEPPAFFIFSVAFIIWLTNFY